MEQLICICSVYTGCSVCVCVCIIYTYTYIQICTELVKNSCLGFALRLVIASIRSAGLSRGCSALCSLRRFGCKLALSGGVLCVRVCIAKRFACPRLGRRLVARTGIARLQIARVHSVCFACFCSWFVRFSAGVSLAGPCLRWCCALLSSSLLTRLECQ